METRQSVESHLRALERDAMAAFAPLGEIFNQSRLTMEKNMNRMRDETLDLLNRLHGHNGAMLSQYTNSRDLASLAAAQEKWLSDFARDCYQATMRINEANRHILADTLEQVGHSIRNGSGKAVEDAAEEAADDGKDA
jgi:hypothetical protein